jgi:hypothetical protein
MVPSRKRTDDSWQTASDEELLPKRICDLQVTIEGSQVEPFIEQLYDELEDKGIRFNPPCYLTTEWLCPDRVPVIGVPFCLAHDRLYQLEKTMMLEVEGGSDKECMKLLRHEAGHALNYAYLLYRRSRWRELFGPMSMEYEPSEYLARPYSRQYVVHLRENYAQAHPDEDFAETFAVWLTPGLDWRTKYRGWAALKKLEYVDHLMQEIKDKPPLVPTGPKLWPVSKVRSTLDSYYKRKRKEFAQTYPAFYDPILAELFTSQAEDGRETAARFLSRYRKTLTNTVAKWALERKYAVDQVVRRLMKRSRELSLYLSSDEEETLFKLGVCITSLVLEARERKKQEEADE